MAHGHADFGISSPLKTVHAVTDLGELLARLNGINSYDRRGNLVRADSFEAAVLHWEPSPSGTGAAIALSTAYARTGENSVALTSGNLSGDFAAILNSYPPLPAGKLGMECHHTVPNVNGRFDFYIFAYNGTTSDCGQIYWNHSTGKLYVRTGLITFVEIASGLNPSADNYYFNPIKFVIDISTRKYVRVLFWNTEYDVSSYSLYSAASATLPKNAVGIQYSTLRNANQTCYVDDFILTQNEP